jgi:uncharacterized UPF0160 family protein
VNPTYANFTHSIQKLDSGDTLMNLSYYYAVDILQMIIHFEFNVQKDKNDRSYGRQLLKTSTNVCKMSQGVLGDFIARMIMEDLHSVIDFDLKCPFKKVRIESKLFKKYINFDLNFQGFYNLKNFVITDRFLPMHLVSDNIKFSLMAKIMGKISKRKPLVHIYTAKGFGEIQK